MPKFHRPFSGFSVDDAAKAKAFYVDIVGLTVNDVNGMLEIDLGDDHHVLVYPKGDAHQPASFTVLNLPVDDVTAAVRELAGRGVEFARYDGMPRGRGRCYEGQWS